MIKAAVIDGNAISRNLLSTLLSNGGFDVVGDGNASSASLAAITRLHPQLVCIDIGTVDEAGWERLDAIRNGLPKALVFMVSGQFEPATVQMAAQRGVHGFIVKPFKEATVLATIRKAVMKVAREHQARSTAPDA
ncbi:two-component system chemotaxis response regulator CheY [Paucimonas lemoignei]|uniref:Two-component system chemotaxis response regulator CheY n=1 Tax=Paucimonas lemoignei TaxID=29443 RepID=A0A4V2UI45_PAULE|nr:response regulator [Paucimonas lemoignei]TCS32747.1 two-component system chemotaxis response regulator CheY [Paucimonas lemoignei]